MLHICFVRDLACLVNSGLNREQKPLKTEQVVHISHTNRNKVTRLQRQDFGPCVCVCLCKSSKKKIFTLSTSPNSRQDRILFILEDLQLCHKILEVIDNM